MLCLIRTYEEEMKSKYPHITDEQLQGRRNKEFATWFRMHVSSNLLRLSILILFFIPFTICTYTYRFRIRQTACTMNVYIGSLMALIRKLNVGQRITSTGISSTPYLTEQLKQQ